MDLRAWADADRTFETRIENPDTGDTAVLVGHVLLGADAATTGADAREWSKDPLGKRELLVRAMPKVYPELASWPADSVESLLVKTGAYRTGGSPLVRGLMHALGMEHRRDLADPEVAADADGPI